jgi:hypothetical protein
MQWRENFRESAVVRWLYSTFVDRTVNCNISLVLKNNMFFLTDAYITIYHNWIFSLPDLKSMHAFESDEIYDANENFRNCWLFFGRILKKLCNISELNLIGHDFAATRVQ